MGWKGELGQQRTAQNTRCQRLALFFPPRGGALQFFCSSRKRRSAGLAGARDWPPGCAAFPQQKPRQLPKGAEREETKQKVRRVPPNKKPRRMGGVLFAKESYYLVVMNTPGPMVELKEMLFT